MRDASGLYMHTEGKVFVFFSPIKILLAKFPETHEWKDQPRSASHAERRWQRISLTVMKSTKIFSIRDGIWCSRIEFKHCKKEIEIIALVIFILQWRQVWCFKSERTNYEVGSHQCRVERLVRSSRFRVFHAVLDGGMGGGLQSCSCMHQTGAAYAFCQWSITVCVS